MGTRNSLIAAALKVIERDGAAEFSTRAVCSLAKVTAPTLYHHFKSADGLLSAAIEHAFEQFLESKRAAEQQPDAESALREGWNNYLRFAAERPRLYAAMISRLILGAKIPAAEQARAMLMKRIKAVAAEGRLAIAADAAADLVWASSHAAALLYVMAGTKQPEPIVIDSLRDRAMDTVFKPKAQEVRT
jgi:AcrR family transcriptional regulator